MSKGAQLLQSKLLFYTVSSKLLLLEGNERSVRHRIAQLVRKRYILDAFLSHIESEGINTGETYKNVPYRHRRGTVSSDANNIKRRHWHPVSFTSLNISTATSSALAACVAKVLKLLAIAKYNVETLKFLYSTHIKNVLLPHKDYGHLQKLGASFEEYTPRESRRGGVP